MFFLFFVFFALLFFSLFVLLEFPLFRSDADEGLETVVVVPKAWRTSSLEEDDDDVRSPKADSVVSVVWVNLLFPEEEAPPPSPFFVVGEDETQPIFIKLMYTCF